MKFTFEILSAKDQLNCERWVRPSSKSIKDENEDENKDESEGDVSKYDDGVLCSGMYLEGARVALSDGGGDEEILQLKDQLPRQLVSKLPVIHFLPEPNHVINETYYVCPVYKVSTRQGVLSTTGISTNFVVSIELPRGSQTSSYWILRGTAALLQ